MKNSLIKALDSKPTDWPCVIEGVLFTHCVTTCTSTKYFLFEVLYNRKAVFPTDIKYNTKDFSNLEEPFDQDMFDTVLESVISLRKQIHHKVEDNIKKVQKNNSTIMTFCI